MDGGQGRDLAWREDLAVDGDEGVADEGGGGVANVHAEGLGLASVQRPEAVCGLANETEGDGRAFAKVERGFEDGVFAGDREVGGVFEPEPGEFGGASDCRAFHG